MKRQRQRRPIFLGVLAVAALLAGGMGYLRATEPYRGFEGEKFVKLEFGTSTRAIASRLADAGVIQSEWVFLMLRALRPSVVLQAGEYQFIEAASPWRVFSRLAQGDIYYFEVTIPEGSNIWDIARMLETQGIVTEGEFLSAAADTELIADLDPEAESLEGYLFPSTYRLSHSITAKELVRMMVDEFRKQWSKLGGENRAPHDTLTLASLVEEETGTPSERSLIAGVFTRRLRVGMNLACDPTVAYAARLSGKYRGAIYKSDLERDHPYNTYKNAGLPPGPISNPGAAAIRAALNPAKTDYLFFVANAEAPGHVFSATTAAHYEAVRNYRNAIAAQAAARKAR